MQNENIMNRRSVRNFTGEPISGEHEKLLLKAGLCAPSAKNSRPWQFIIVKDKERLLTLSAIRKYWGPAAGAAAVIVVCGNTRDYKGSDLSFIIQDCSAAAENILVAAEGLGLGGVWMGCYPTEEGINGLRSLLNIPASVTPACVLALGHPASHPAPHDEWDEGKIHYETY